MQDNAERIALKIRLTEFQTTEVEHGMSIDTDMGREPWGIFTYIGKKGGAWLEITNLPAAIYRITSDRDIWLDNAGGGWPDPGARSGARSLSNLVDKIVDLAGGRDAVLALPQIPWGSDEDPEATIGGEDLARWL